ncbi:hypothetical protein GCM10009624_19900 [Gordonia sinesedis]
MPVALACVALGAAGCADAESTPAQPSSSTPSSAVASAPRDPAICARTPPSGRIERSGRDLSFENGKLYVAVTPASSGPPAPPTPAAPTSGPGIGTATGTTCYEFTKWGNPSPDVPPDALLFTFAGARGDGAQIEFLVVDLTGGVLPPIGPVRPTVGPLNQPINAAVGVSAGGVYRHSTTCALRITAMSPQRAAGSFDCPTATASDANPFDPSDDGNGEDSATSTAPPPASARLSGWFDLPR